MDTQEIFCESSGASTAELVLASQSGDNGAFCQLVERFERLVQAVCWQRLRDYVEVEEATQDVFIKAFEKLDQLREPEAFAGWLRSIALRQSINRCTRRPKSIGLEPQALDAMDAEIDCPLDAMLLQERSDQLHEGLGRLAQIDRSTLEAFYLRGQSLLEMSDEFDAPLGTIKRRLHVARKRLAVELECLQAV